MNRAHAYKAAVEQNLSSGEKDPDKGITMGLYSYPILMAADILMFNADEVPVGKDQVQHLEMARDIAGRFNHHFGEHFTLPQAVVDDSVAVLPGTDGRKMSKSYNNTIPLWLPEKKLRKAIMKIKTNSLEPGEPKDADDSALFALYRAFADEQQASAMRQAFAEGIGWGEAKQKTFELINAQLAEPRERYHEWMANPASLAEVLHQGAEKARAYASPFLQKLKHAVGLRPMA